MLTKLALLVLAWVILDALASFDPNAAVLAAFAGGWAVDKWAR